MGVHRNIEESVGTYIYGHMYTYSMNQTTNERKTFKVSYVNGSTYIGAMPKLARCGEVMYVTSSDDTHRMRSMVGIGSGFWRDMVRRFKAVRENFETEAEFLAYLGVDKSKMERY